MPRLVVKLRLPLGRFDLDVELESSAHVIGVFGPSGSGKTSLLESIAGLRRDATGVITLDSQIWLDSAKGVALKTEARGVGYVPQDGLLFPHLDVKQNLLAGSRRARAASKPIEETLREVSSVLGLEPLWSRPVSLLSGGERQRVALGRALCSAPALLLLDEPLTGLDLPLRRRLLPFIRRVRDEFAVPMLVVSHDPTEVQALCDELLALRDGRVIARGAPREVLADPAVYELAEGGFENTLPCTVLAADASSARVRLGASIEVATRGAAVAVGTATLVGIPARDLIVATERPTGLSARNVIAARVVAIHAAGHRRILVAELAADVPMVLVELSDHACSQLDLRDNASVFVVFKAASCALYPGGQDGESLGETRDA